MKDLQPSIKENGISYVLVGDYYIPELALETSCPIGRWGRMHLAHLKNNRPILYSNLMLSGTFNKYLHDLDTQAAEQLECIIKQMKHTEGMDETQKCKDPLEWVRRMNSIRDRAEEIVKHELIFC